jgi:hypothetical protein
LVAHPNNLRRLTHGQLLELWWARIKFRVVAQSVYTLVETDSHTNPPAGCEGSSHQVCCHSSSGTLATSSSSRNANRQPLEVRDLNSLEARPFSLELYGDEEFNEDIDYHPLLDLGDQRTKPDPEMLATDSHFELVQPPGVQAPG